MMTQPASNPSAERPAGASGGAARLFVQFEFLRLDERFHLLQPNEKLVARQEFLSAFEPFQRTWPFFKAYSLHGLRADSDLLIWRMNESLELIQNSSEHLRTYGAGKYLVPSHSYLGLASASPSPAEPDGQAAPKHLFLRVVVRGPDWISLAAPQRQALAAEESGIESSRPSVRTVSFEGFGGEGDFLLQAHLTDAPLEFADLARELRQARSARLVSAESQVFPCIYKDIRDIVETFA
ncbi:MAG: chlorite dismutase family protein [Elusimicrobia bacterium]|nr:chlorite dismutase family protein [Elusimicrobiota bacterium]